jgi:hypothetical protein
MKISQIIKDRIDKLGWHGAYLSQDERCALDLEIDEIVGWIKSSFDFCEADAVLKELGEFETFLSLLLCKYHLTLSDKQKKLINEFDRSDDVETRHRLYKDIKENRFP